jgi:hypothetical protein
MRVIGREGIREFQPVRTRTQAMETMEETRARRAEEREEREQNRLAQQRIAEEASTRRSVREAGTIVERVAEAQRRLKDVPAGATLSIIEAQSDVGRELFLLAEEYGRGREEILRRFPKVSGEVRAEYLQAMAEVPEPQPAVSEAERDSAMSSNGPDVPANADSGTMSAEADTAPKPKRARKRTKKE